MTGFRSALTRVLNDYARKQKLLKDDDANLTGEDVREGLVAVVSVKLPEPQFEGQTKTRLGNPEVKGLAESAIAEGLSSTSKSTRGRPPHHREVHHVGPRPRGGAQGARPGHPQGPAGRHAAARQARRLLRPRPRELRDVHRRGPSAGGSAKGGRDRRFQAILPLQGKILNVERARLDRIFGHAEIAAMIKALGAGIDDDFDLAQAALPPRDHHDRRGRRRRAHPHAAADASSSATCGR